MTPTLVLYRPPWRLLADRLADLAASVAARRTRVIARCQACLAAWGDLRFVAHLDAHTLRDIGVPEGVWQARPAAASDLLGAAWPGDGAPAGDPASRW